MAKLTFVQLNIGWNAEPNAPEPQVITDGSDVLLNFYVNPFRFKEFEEDERGTLRFVGCSKYRLGPTNDEGWWMGQCRFSKLAPHWGEFYEVSGSSEILDQPEDWRVLDNSKKEQHHFLLYFRDDTFECDADLCLIEPSQSNALLRTGKQLPPLLQL